MDSMVVRRRATKEELEQGIKEMEESQKRIDAENRIRGEEPIEDQRSLEGESKLRFLNESVENVEEGVEEKSSNPVEGQPRPAVPPTPPPEKPPAFPSSSMVAVKTSKELTPEAEAKEERPVGMGSAQSSRRAVTEESKRDWMQETPNGPQQTPQSAKKPEFEMGFTPLFTPEQIQQMTHLHMQAPWLYGTSSSGFGPTIQRPGFLEMDEKRINEELREKDKQIDELKTRMFRDQQEQSEIKRLLLAVVEENKKLKDRVLAVEMQPQDFATPDSHSKDGSIQADGSASMNPRRLQGLKLEGLFEQEAARPPKEDGLDGRQVKEQEAARPPKEDGLGGQQAKEQEAARPPKEDGLGGQQAKEPEAARPPKEEGPRGQQEKGGDFNSQSMELMFLMVQSMRDLQKKIQDGKGEDGSVMGVEVVRSGAPDLPDLLPWASGTGPLQLGDWMLLLNPIISDLTTTSHDWWNQMTKEVEAWYQRHISMSPLDRLNHGFAVPESLQQPRWQRLERRVFTMPMKAIPEGCKEELVAARRLDVYGVLTYLYTAYCPSGVAEKQHLLKSLEDPSEITSVHDAPAAIRRWLRWRRRAREVGAVEPDPAILLKGLNRMTKKILESHRDLQFRVSLVRSNLAVDTTPTSASVDQLAAHLLAELEQLAITEKKVTAVPKKEQEGVKIKALEADVGEKDKGKGKGRERNEDEKGRQKCRYYLTEGGCKKGRECAWSHEQKDEVRRCYVCGSSQHLAPSCTRPRTSSSSPEKSNQKSKQMKKDGEEGVLGRKEEAESSSPQDSTMKDLIDEAGKVLRSLSSATPSSASSNSSCAGKEGEGREDVMERLQQQLNALRQKQKVLRLQRMVTGDHGGLIDSGATHPLRPAKPGEDISGYPVVGVSLADGRKIQLRMSPGKAMISPDQSVEPIVPMGPLAEALGCQITWEEGKILVRHPLRGDLKVEQHQGCPQISRQLALDLIAEMENFNLGVPKEMPMKSRWEWMKAVVETHPVLSKLPAHVRNRLAVQPGQWNGLPCNRRWRKAMERDGLLLHLYAGEKSGFTFEAAWRQSGGEEKVLLELDVKRSPQHDLLPDDGVYASLLTAALQGKVHGILGGPNCRTRSVLRHYDIPGCENPPRPVRAWNGGEYGKEDLTEREERMVQEDDILLWRQVFLFIIGTYARRAHGQDRQMAFVLEQPSSPKEYKPEVVSFWDQWEWQAIKREFNLNEVHFTQKSLGGEATKPTTLGTSLELSPEDFQVKGLRYQGEFDRRKIWRDGHRGS